MADPDRLPQAPALTLPSALLHFAPPEPHPDSEEFRLSNRHRTAQELIPIHEQGPPETYSNQHLDPTASQARRSPTTRSHGISTSSYRGAWQCPSDISTASDSLGPEQHNERRYRLRRQVPHWYDPVVKFWRAQVSVTIDEGAHRDHLALERTFLAYLRTSLALAMTGIIIAQLFRLQHTVNPNPNLGFFLLGIPLASVFICFGMVVLLIGAFRFWRQQNAMVRGKVHAGGWEMTAIMAFSLIICLAAFILVTAIDIEKSYL